MSNFDGYVNVAPITGQGMITLRGDLGNIDIKNAATGVTGVDMPAMGMCNFVENNALAWMSPDELLVMVDAPAPALETMHQTLSGVHALAVDVSDARAMFRLTGQSVREVLAKIAPIDTHPDALPVGALRRTRLAQVAGAFWLRDDNTADVICFRSVGDYVYALLCDASRQGAQVFT